MLFERGSPPECSWDFSDALDGLLWTGRQRAITLPRGRKEGAMPRGGFLLGVGIGLVAIAFSVTCELLRQPGITETNVRRIRSGMTLQQVEGILGEPAHQESRNGLRLLLSGGELARIWRTREGAVHVVGFGGDGRVVPN